MATVFTRNIKQAVRHLVTRCGSPAVYSAVRKLSGANVEYVFHDSLAQRFSSIYSQGVWLNDRDRGSRSGIGSELESTQMVRKLLPEMLDALGTRVLLDAGCGDFTWMKEVELPSRYIGADIVGKVIEENSNLYASAGRTFQVLDATRDPLPEADTILCREVLIHLSFTDIWRLIENVRTSGALFFVATNDSGIRLNADIRSGDFRLVNLRQAPFRFPEPLRSLSDDHVAPGRTVAAWAVSSLPRSR
jgi:2-polyprenyl-3-methyl-5-hydroxy-6-metoxy-1,4-benzoquinol methylase